MNVRQSPIILGEADERPDCSNPAAVNKVIAELIGQAQRSILVLANTLDLPGFKSADMEARLSKFVTLHPQNRARFLIEDEVYFVRHNPRLIELCRRFSTYLQVRRLAPDYWPPEELIIVADEIGYLKRSTTQPPILAHMNSPAEARPLARRVKDLWEYGEYLPELHPLGL